METMKVKYLANAKGQTSRQTITVMVDSGETHQVKTETPLPNGKLKIEYTDARKMIKNEAVYIKGKTYTCSTEKAKALIKHGGFEKVGQQEPEKKRGRPKSYKDAKLGEAYEKLTPGGEK